VQRTPSRRLRLLAWHSSGIRSEGTLTAFLVAASAIQFGLLLILGPAALVAAVPLAAGMFWMEQSWEQAAWVAASAALSMFLFLIAPYWIPAALGVVALSMGGAIAFYARRSHRDLSSELLRQTPQPLADRVLSWALAGGLDRTCLRGRAHRSSELGAFLHRHRGVRFRPTSERWRAGSGCEAVSLRGVHYPESAVQVAEIVKAAHKQGLQARAVGQGIASPTDVQISLLLMRDVTVIRDAADDAFASVEAGVNEEELLRAVRPHGVELPQLDAIGGGSAPAVLNALADVVEEIEIVDTRGRIRSFSRAQNGELVAAIRGDLGRFGILTRATFRVQTAPAAKAPSVENTAEPRYSRVAFRSMSQSEYAGA